MNKAELIGALRQETGLSRPKAKEVVELFLDEMSNALANGDRVEIRGLCSIFVKQYKGLYWQESQDRRTQAGTTKETTLL